MSNSGFRLFCDHKVMILFKEMLRIDLCIVLVVCGRYFSFALYIGFLTVIILLEKNKTMFICVYHSPKQNPSKFLWQGFLIIRFYSIRLTHLSCRTCKQQRFLQGFFLLEFELRMCCMPNHSPFARIWTEDVVCLISIPVPNLCQHTK